LRFFFEITTYPIINKIKEIAHYFKKEKFSKNEVIPVKDKIYVLKSGRVAQLIQSNFIRTIETGSLFGDFFIINLTSNDINRKNTSLENSTKSNNQLIHPEIKKDSNIKKQENNYCIDDYKIISNTEVVAYSITRSDFLEHFIKIDILKEKVLVLNQLENQNIKQEELYFIENLGMGRFGNVRLVHDQKHCFAIKAINKKQTSKKKKKLLQYLLNEKLINQNLDHQFIVKFIKTMVTNDYIFFLMEYLEGITFKKLLERKNLKLSRNDIQFYAANILLMLDYLNSRSVIHRDLKPDNLILGKNVNYHLKYLL